MARRNILTAFCVLLCITGCAGTQWEKQKVDGSTGPVYEIRASRTLPANKQVPQQVAAMVDPQARQLQLQEQLMKMSAMMKVTESKDYKVGTEDLLQISFLESDKLSAAARVNGQGDIRLLLVGDVHVSGLTPAEISRKLSQLYKEKEFLVNPQITVSVQEYRAKKVAVTGAVNKPEQYALIGPRTLLEVLGMAGGLSDKAGETVHIMRPRKDPQAAETSSQDPSMPTEADTTVVALDRLLLKGDTSLNLPIQNGDVVFVPPARTAFVLGAVSKPGGVLLQDNMTITKAIANSGGLHPILASSNATILRVDETGQRQTLPIDLGQITKGAQEDVALKSNDIVYVHESGTRRFFFDLKMFLPTGSIGTVPGLF
ncbi:MAG: polysaccharide biosynthesis/export family protein [Syntrophobacteraceae bacterium]